jgi:hypothetical protein
MADQTTGGDGSVRWSLTADNVDPIFVVNNHAGSGKGKHYQAGIDQDGAIGSWFTVSVKTPADMDRDDYLAALKSGVGNLGIKPGPGADRVHFRLRIEAYNPDQIRVSWAGRGRKRKGGGRKGGGRKGGGRKGGGRKGGGRKGAGRKAAGRP